MKVSYFNHDTCKNYVIPYFLILETCGLLFLTYGKKHAPYYSFVYNTKIFAFLNSFRMQKKIIRLVSKKKNKTMFNF